MIKIKKCEKCECFYDINVGHYCEKDIITKIKKIFGMKIKLKGG